MKTFFNILLCSLLLSLSVSQAFALAQEDAEAAAEEKYPLYQDGEEVVVVFGVGREPVKTYRGIYHPVGKTQIRIGRDMFKLKDLPERIRARFEPSLNARLRKEEVEHLMATEQSRSGASTKSTSRNPVESSPSQVESLPVAPAVSSDAGGMREKAKEARAAADLAFKRCEELQIRQLCKDIMLDADLAFQHGREAYVSIKVGKDQAVANFQKAEQLCNQAIASGLSRLESDAREAMKNRQWEQARSHAVWAAKIDSTKGEELLLRTDHAEADWYWQCAEAAMKKRDWKLARENRKALSKLDQERGRELSSLINQTEAEYCYTQVAKGLKNENTDNISSQISRLSEIKGDRAYELLAQAVQEIVDYGIAKTDWSLARRFLSKLEKDDNTLVKRLAAQIDKAEADYAFQVAKNAIPGQKWNVARDCINRLKTLKDDRADGLLTQLDQVEADYWYGRLSSALQREDGGTISVAMAGLRAINTTHSRELQSQAVKDLFDFSVKKSKQALAGKNWKEAREWAESAGQFDATATRKLLLKIDEGEIASLCTEANAAQSRNAWSVLKEKTQRLAQLSPDKAKPFQDKLNTLAGTLKLFCELTTDEGIIYPECSVYLYYYSPELENAAKVYFEKVNSYNSEKSRFHSARLRQKSAWEGPDMTSAALDADVAKIGMAADRRDASTAIMEITRINSAKFLADEYVYNSGFFSKEKLSSKIPGGRYTLVAMVKLGRQTFLWVQAIELWDETRIVRLTNDSSCIMQL